MTVLDINNFINNIAPFQLSESWDNCGILIGDVEKQVEKCCFCLDITEDIVNEVIKNKVDLIVTHHPLIFSGLKNILSDNLAYKLIQNDIAVISAHTNLDKALNGINDVLIKKINLKPLVIDDINLENSFIRVGKLEKELSPLEFAELVKQNLNCGCVRLIEGENKIEKVAVVSGSGGDFLNDVINLDVDAFVTGDVKHNILIDALNNGITLIDAGHFETENIIFEDLIKVFKNNFKDIDFYIAKNNLCPIKYV